MTLIIHHWHGSDNSPIILFCTVPHHTLLGRPFCELLYFYLYYCVVMKHLVIYLAASFGGERCTLPKVTGPCFGAFQRYYYNAATETCETFLYGGCAGNANNFATEEDCVAACLEKQGNVSLFCCVYCPSIKVMSVFFATYIDHQSR